MSFNLRRAQWNHMMQGYQQEAERYKAEAYYYRKLYYDMVIAQEIVAEEGRKHAKVAHEVTYEDQHLPVPRLVCEILWDILKKTKGVQQIDVQMQSGKVMTLRLE